MRRVSVIGISGSGKTTLARELAARLGARHVELDALFHQAGWRPLDTQTFRERVAELLDCERWIVDGSYRAVVENLVWRAADTVVWLDLSRRVILPRLARRTVGRMWTREELWNGNRERWIHLFDPRPMENILLWMWTRHRRQRRWNAAMLAAPEHAALTVHRLRTPSDVEAFRRRFGLGDPSTALD